MTTRRSDLAVVIFRLMVDGEVCLLLLRHPKWGDWGLVGGHVESFENAAEAAARETEEELPPIQVGHDLRLAPLLEEPISWGPVASRSASGLPTRYSTNFFAAEFLRQPEAVLGRLQDRDIIFVPESNLDPERWPEEVTDVLARLANRLGGFERIPLAWAQSIDSSRAHVPRLEVDDPETPRPFAVTAEQAIQRVRAGM